MRYLSIEPLFSNSDQFCRINVGCDQVRCTIQIFPDESMIADVAAALEAEEVKVETPTGFRDTSCFDSTFDWQLSVMPSVTGNPKTLRSCTWDCTQPDANSHSEIRISLNAEGARDLAEELRKWLRHPSCSVAWYEL